MLLHNSWPMSLVARKPAEGTDVSAWMLWIWIYSQGTKHRPNEMGIMPHCEKFSHWPVCTIPLHNPCKFSFCYSWLKTVVVWVGQSNLAFCCRVEIISIPGSAMSKMFFQHEEVCFCLAIKRNAHQDGATIKPKATPAPHFWTGLANQSHTLM
jgi:hypothetical protein